MRRLAAALGILAFANLSLVQAGGRCPVAASHEQMATVTSPAHHGEHEGHPVPAANLTETLDESPTEEAGHATCLMTGPCGLNVDLGSVVIAAALPQRDVVQSGSVALPASLTTTPDIPPPRA